MRIRNTACLLCVALITLIFITGCRPVTVQTTPLPRTNLEVRLEGPDEKGHYLYMIKESGAIVASRFLGPAQVTSQSVPSITDDGKGLVTLTWGSGHGSAFTTIDTKRRLIVEDANQANQPNQPFRLQP